MGATVATAVVRIPTRVLVTDLDRTLTGADLALDAAALDAVEELRDSGVPVVLATGRRWEEVHAMGLPACVDAVVAENGAVIAVGAHDVHVRHATFVAAARAALAELAAVVRWGRVVGSLPRGSAIDASGRLVERGVAHAIEYNAEEAMLLPPDVDKASGARLALARLGHPDAEVWAIGDGENDASLLRWASVGFAPANAAPEARRAADVALASSYADAFVDVARGLLAAEGRLSHRAR